MRRLAKIEEDLRLDRWVDPDGGKTPLVDWAWRWFDSWVDLKPKTRVSYASLLRNQILPTFGRRQLSRIRPIDVQEWIAGMQNLDLSASRVRQANHLLRSIMKALIAEGDAFDAAGVTHCSGSPKTCAPLWFADPTIGGGLYVIASPVVADGVVYVGSGDSKLHAFGLPPA